jgi:PAS domain S-box-containing protein
MKSTPVAAQPIDSIVNRLPAAVFEYTYVTDGTKGFTYISPYCEVLFDLTSNMMMNGTLSLRSFIHPEDRESFVNNFQSCIESASTFNWEGRIVTSKRQLWISALATPAKMKDQIVWTGILSDISSRKSAEKSSQEIEQRLELAAKGSDLGIWDYNFRTNTTVINERWAEIIGYPKAQLEEMFNHCEDFIHPDDLPRYKATLENHLRGHTDYYEAVYRFQLKDTSWRWVMERGQVVERDDKGDALRTVGTFQDFQNRKVEEQISLATEVRYSSLLESLPLGVGIHQNGVLVYANSYAARIMGAQSPAELIGKAVLDFVHPDFRPMVIERMKGLMKGTIAPTAEEKFVKMDGTDVMVETYAVPFQFNGKPAIQIIVKDITDQFEAQRAIRKSETLFYELFYNSPFGKVMLDEHGKVALVNAGFEKMFGFTQKELFGKELNQFIVPQNLASEGNDLDSLIAARQVVRIDSIRKRKDGEKIPVIVYGLPIQLENKTIGIFGSYVDMTDQKKTEEELKIRNAELDNFVYKVSHDLRAPLSSVLGLVNLAQLEGNTDSLADYIKIIGQKIKQLDSFISDVLSHSKNLKLDVRIESIDLNKMVDNTFTNLNYMKGVETIKKSIQINQAPFFSDPWRLGEIFRNLISNAIKYSDRKKTQSQISIKIEVNNEKASIYFADNGIGIEEENVKRIFDMFYRASDQSDGSGLGLYIVKNAVDKLSGTIQVNSVVGEGTSFELTLPNHTGTT